MESNPLYLKSEKKIINLAEQQILKNIAQRVSDSPNCVVKNGIPRTDGVNIFLPFNDKSLKFEDLEGLAAHEGSHIRFKSINDPQIPKELFPKNPQFAQLILNICEDARIEKLLSETFPGFWEEIDELNLRILTQKLDSISQFPINKLNSPAAVELLINLLSFEGCSHSELIFNPLLSNLGKFKFSSSKMGVFWREISESLKFIREEKTFVASLVASKRILYSILNYFDSKDDFLSKQNSEKRNAIDKSEKEKQKEKLPLDRNKDEENEESPEMEEILKDIKEIISKEIKRSTSSGISSKKLNKKSQDILRKIRTNLQTKKKLSKNEFKEFITENSEELEKSKEQILSILKELKEKSRIRRKSDTKISEKRKIDDKTIIEIFRNERNIQELNNIKDPIQIYNEIVKNYSYLINELKIRFSPIRSSLKMQRGLRRGYICGRDLAQVKISKGQFKSPFKYNNRDKGARLILLIDESGSMNGMRIKIAKESCIILAESLRNTRITFAIIGFGAKYSQNVICEKVYKDFNENLNTIKIGSIGISNIFMENRDGTSFKSVIQHHFKKQNSTNSTPILIIISDGQPHHGGTSYIGSVAIEDTRKAIFSIQKMGIKLYAISIDSREGSYLSKIYRPNQYVVLRNLGDLTSKLIFLIKQIANALSH
ncbi:MAG: VWA domain-containing protein [Promethearchaeota archaeon]